METASEVVAATSEKNKTTSEVEFPGRGGRILGREGSSANLKDGLGERENFCLTGFRRRKPKPDERGEGRIPCFPFCDFSHSG